MKQRSGSRPAQWEGFAVALRNILVDGDPKLRKTSRTVEVIDDRIRMLLDDMAETMYAANGVGLAAPQVGVLKRIVVIDVGDGLIELINPEIVERVGEQCGPEGCLSIPEFNGYVVRPQRVTVKALDRNGNGITVVGEGLLGVALCHETDHLDGVLFKDRVIEPTEEQVRAYEERMRQEEAAKAPPRGRRSQRVVRRSGQGE